MAVPAQKPGRSKQNYATPEVFIKAVKGLLGITDFGWDFAADATNTKAQWFWSEKDSALVQSWDDGCLSSDEWGWLNPPFADIKPWVVRSLTSGLKIAMLVPASVGSNWYRDYVNNQYGVTVLFLNGRLSFDGTGPYPKDLMLILFGQGGEFSSTVWNWRVA